MQLRQLLESYVKAGWQWNCWEGRVICTTSDSFSLCSWWDLRGSEEEEEWAQIKNPVQLHVAALPPKK